MGKRKFSKRSDNANKKKKEDLEDVDEISDDDQYVHHPKGINYDNYDDESIDDNASEVGWNSDDELLFNSKKSTHSNESYESDESDEVSGYDSDDLNHGGILLSDTIGKKDLDSTSTVNKKKQYDQDDESIEAEYEEGEEEEEDIGDDIDEEEIEEIHDRLLNAIDKFAASTEKTPDRKSKKFINNAAPDSVYTPHANGDQNVSMDALIGALSDKKGLSAVKKHLTELEKDMNVPTYIDKVVSTRIERKETYLNTKKEVSRWQDLINKNRHLSTLDLTVEDRKQNTFKSMIHRFEPKTDMEKEINMVLLENGVDEKKISKMEQDELESRNLSLKEIRQKQAELAKVKALMFYEQMKRHRINKIKSKAYRSIRKKKKLRAQRDAEALKEEILDLSDMEDKEKEVYDRVKERMDLRHKNTGKWAKMALNFSHTDKSLRDAYHDSVRLGQEIIKKVNEDPNSDRSNKEEKDVYDDDSDLKLSVLSNLKEVLQDSKEHDSNLEFEGKYKKLFSMDFMKRAAEQQRQKAKEDAKNVLREIEELESGAESQDESIEQDSDVKKSHDLSYLSHSSTGPKKIEVSDHIKGQVDDMFMGNSSMNILNATKKSSMKFSSSIGLDSESVDHELGKAKKTQKSSNNHSEIDGALESDPDTEANPWLNSGSLIKTNRSHLDLTESTIIDVTSTKRKYEKTLTDIDDALEKSTSSRANTEAGINSQGSSQIVRKDLESKKTKKKGKKQINDAGAAKDIELPKVPSSTKVHTNEEKTQLSKQNETVSKSALSNNLDQDELVRMAFSGPNFEEEFQAYKGKEIDKEYGLDEKRMKVLSQVKAGWGDWAGPGQMMVSDKILKKRDNLITKIHKEHEEKKSLRKDNKKMNVMISEKKVRTASKYKISDIPHPFSSREEYERSIQMPLGDAWNSSIVVKANTQPEVKTKAGRVLEPIQLKKAKK